MRRREVRGLLSSHREGGSSQGDQEVAPDVGRWPEKCIDLKVQ